MITKKLLTFQKEDVRVEKDATNPFYKSGYTTLNEVLSKVKEPLNKLGILILQTPTKEGLKTELIDTEDDTRIEALMPYVGAVDAQKLGSANTYCRRYSLITILGLEEADDDGNEAVKPAKPAWRKDDKDISDNEI